MKTRHTPSMISIRHSRLCLLLSCILFSTNAFASWDEGLLRKIILWEQSEAGTATLASDPYRFIASVWNSAPPQTAYVTLPDGGTWPESPNTIIDSSQLFGFHYNYEVSFSSLAGLNTAFPNGEYIFDITRTHSEATTEFSAPVSFSGTKSIPSGAPVIQNTTWNAGTLVIHPAAAQIYYTPADGVGFGVQRVRSGGAGRGRSSNAPGLLDLNGSLRFGASYSVEFRYFVTDDSITINDPNAPSWDQELEYSTTLESVVRFEMVTPEAAADFQLQSATYISNGNSWNVLSLLESKYEPWNPDSLFWRMDEWELTLGNPTWEDGILQITYMNADGEFSGEVPFYRNPWEHGMWDNYLILPNPFHMVPEPSIAALLIGGIASLTLLRRRRK